ncbi:MAG: HD domain-containing protein [Spirochaetaceae bacterium]|nr:HD domain-containing protein [Spirochaetaceae bacterium]
MENRVEILRNFIQRNIPNRDNNEERLELYMHMYAVSQFCAMIALKRNQNAELAAMAGLLHDLHTYKTLDSKGHAKKGAVLAKEILKTLNVTTDEETEKICSAIYSHSKKKNKHSDFTEVLVDADVLQHYLYNTELAIIEKDKERLKKIIKEFGLG